MQSLAAYRFEASVEDAELRLRNIRNLIDAWLVQKGVDDISLKKGGFVSKTDSGGGEFFKQEFVSGGDLLSEVELIETAHSGDVFFTNIQLTITGNKVIVCASLAASPGESRLAPIRLYPKCPRVVREIINEFPDWKFEGETIPMSRFYDASSHASARLLCSSIVSASRKLPVVVVSGDEDEAVWQDLAPILADNLVGLASVALVSAESSWHLTDELGPRNSCYLGAVKIYWPSKRQDGSLVTTTWLATRQLNFGGNDVGRSKFVSAVRQEIMSVAALVMSPPDINVQIRQSAERQRLLALTVQEREKELSSIVEENSRLLAELAEARNKIKSLEWKIKSDGYKSNDDATEEDDSDELDVHIPPESGETRYYKKIGSGGGVDSLVVTKACNHKGSNWKPAFKGDQAEKGLLKLEGRNDWKSIAHCSACTGGGRWRVSW